jgi:hypothetical protein
MLERIISLKAKGSARLLITFHDGNEYMVDLEPVAAKGGLASSLLSVEFLAQASIMDEGTHVEWPNGLDIAADSLYRRAVAVSSKTEQ